MFLEYSNLALILKTFKSYRSNHFGSILGVFLSNLYRKFSRDAPDSNAYICDSF